MSRNICNCPDPPGGQVICESHQLAICIVKNGKATQQCLDPIKTDNPLELVNWTLSKITGTKRSPENSISTKDINILLNQKYVHSGATTIFRLPDSIITTIRRI